ncbi:MAG: 2,3-diaminopropionate biosynthesis protein SbnA [Acidobacteriota bacterium]|nr:2,3-diaminopropionate biosynthesis protein SbnA [Acidobacteriota bacterium]
MSGVLDVIGGTPLVPLEKLFREFGFRVFAKLEGLNPGGSIKDRPAVSILNAALRSGVLSPGAVVVESSSGNMGIGLAQACRYHDLRFICVVDSKTQPQNIRVLEAYGAEVDYVDQPDPISGEFLQARLARVRELLSEHPNSFWPNQYANENNPLAHFSSTMPEIVEQLDGPLDYLFLATSTCGTMAGCADFVERHGLPTKIYAVDALGSQIFASEPAERYIPGLGAGLRPPLCNPSQVVACVHVSNMDCVVGCRRLVAEEAILAGGSSGGLITAVLRLAPQIPDGANCVVILPDRGERYLDTIYNDEWMREKCGEPVPESDGLGASVPLPAPTVTLDTSS